MKLKDIKEKLSGTAVAAVIAIVALLIITVDLKNKKDVAVAELANAEVGISTVESEYLDSIALLEGTIQAYELELGSIKVVLTEQNSELATIESELNTAEAVATQLADQLVTANATIIDLKANPNCLVE